MSPAHPLSLEAAEAMSAALDALEAAERPILGTDPGELGFVILDRDDWTAMLYATAAARTLIADALCLTVDAMKAMHAPPS